MWPGGFERMEQFIQDTGLTAADLELNYDDVVEMFGNGQLAMYFGSSAGVGMFQEQGIDATFLPIFSQNGEKWLMTTALLPSGIEPRFGAGSHPARKGDADPARYAVGGCAGTDPCGRAGPAQLQPERKLPPDRHHEGRALGGGRKPHVYPHRLQRFLCHLAGCGLQDDRGRI